MTQVNQSENFESVDEAWADFEVCVHLVDQIL